MLAGFAVLSLIGALVSVLDCSALVITLHYAFNECAPLLSSMYERTYGLQMYYKRRVSVLSASSKHLSSMYVWYAGVLQEAGVRVISVLAQTVLINANNICRRADGGGF